MISTTASRQLQNLLQSFLKVFLLKLINPCFEVTFGVAQSFVGLSLSNTSHIKIKCIAVWGVRWLDFRSDVIVKMFWPLLLRFAAYVGWCRGLLQDVGSFGSHPLYPGQSYLLQALEVGLQVESEAMWEDKWRCNLNRKLFCWAQYLQTWTCQINCHPMIKIKINYKYQI